MTKNRTKNIFTDENLTPGIDFFRAYINSSDFTVSMLRSMLRNSKAKFPSKATKEELSEIASNHFTNPDNTLSSNYIHIINEIISKPRRWTSILHLGKTTKTPSNANIFNNGNFLTNLCKNGDCFGPFTHDKASGIWYIINIVDNTGKEDTNDDGEKVITFVPARWLITANISTDGYVSFHWDGFSYRDQRNIKRPYPFWGKLPRTFGDFCTNLGHGDYKDLNLSRLILKKVWKKYYSSATHIWTHKRIRAHSDGISLNAHESGKGIDLDVKGITSFASKIATTVLKSVDFNPNKKTKEIATEAAVQLIIKEWGTISYEFELNDIGNPEVTSTLFSGHCYFGLKRGSRGKAIQDSMVHIKAYISKGGSWRASRFIISADKE